MAEQKETIELEYMLNTSPAILFNRLSSPSGLTEWFADNVIVDGKIYTFFWNGVEQQAEQILRKENKMVRYQWIDEEEGNPWFEFQIHVDELTGDVALIIIDHVDPAEKDDTIDLWDRQIIDLKRGLGSL